MTLSKSMTSSFGNQLICRHTLQISESFSPQNAPRGECFPEAADAQRIQMPHLSGSALDDCHHKGYSSLNKSHQNYYEFEECLHRFCEDCITAALRRGNKECPTCRKKLVSRRSLRQDSNFDALIRAVSFFFFFFTYIS